MTEGPHRPAPLRTLLLAGLTIVLTIGFVALGFWQIERRAWKADLIDRIENRVAAEPVAPPERENWPEITREGAEYLRVSVEGQFLDREVLAQAVTERGSGYWVLSPLVTVDGETIIVNRGFVPSGERMATRGVPEGAQRIIGLLRLPEPGGGFLRANDPEAGRWYSRDVVAIAEDMGLGEVAPFFIDAEAGTNGGGSPMGGLTVIEFRNTHLVYALTWFTLAAMSMGATVMVVYAGLRPMRPTQQVS